MGGMATVYQAVHDRNHRLVALKVLHRELGDYDEICERLHAEAAMSNLVDHPGTVRFLDDGVLETGEPFLVMEYLEGKTLEELWTENSGRLQVQQMLKIAADVLDILAAAHARGIIHRDIKPDNIFVTRDGQTKLLDFGIARSEMVDKGFVTHSGRTMGTPAYMPPEQARGRWDDLDARADIFSLSATMYAVLSGQPIHQAETGNELLLAAMSEPVRPLRIVQPDLPECVSAVIDRGLSFRKEDRFSSAREMEASVRMALRGIRDHNFDGVVTLLKSDLEGPKAAAPASHYAIKECATLSSASFKGASHKRRVPNKGRTAALAFSIMVASGIGLHFAPQLLTSLRQISAAATESAMPDAAHLMAEASSWLSSVGESVHFSSEATPAPEVEPKVAQEEDTPSTRP